MLKKYIILLAISTGLLSCNEDILNVENPNVPTQDTFWGTVDDAQKGLTAVYSQFTRVGNWSRWIYFRYDLTSDEGYSNTPWGELGDWTRFVYVNYNFIQGGHTIFKGHYKQIFQCNQIIAYAPDIEGENDAENDLRDAIIAQAKFIRALDYFNLVVLFENLPISLEPSKAGDKHEVGGPDVIYPIIIQDLEDAIADLPEVWTEDADKGRVTKGAAYALLGKVYMQLHQWQDAKDAFDHLVTGDLALYYGLMDDYVDNFTHYKENNMESVFEIQFSDANETSMDMNNGSDIDDDIAEMSLGSSRSQFFAPTGWKDGQPRPWLVDEYKREQTVDSLENGNYYDTRLLTSIIYPDMFKDFPNVTLFNGTITKWKFTWKKKLFFRKYGDDYFKERTDYFSPINYRVIRYADVLLCYAECLAELDDVANAVIYVDRVRQRPSTNLPPMASSSDPDIAASINSKDTFLKRLQMERSLELSLESVRWIDLRRWGLLETQEGIDELITRDADFENFELGKHHILPLPQLEVDNNPNLEQNPNY
ncbi:MAG: RagB/SusD family nutrient uptake outer membrane protein [Bacteroidota bacterium]